MERILELQEQNQVNYDNNFNLNNNIKKVKVDKDKVTATENFKNSREVKLFQFSK